MMTHKNLAVADNMVVSLEYVLKLDDGAEIDRSESAEPLQYLQGHSQIISGLEKALYGLRAGDEKLVVIAPEDAYGEYDPEEVEKAPRKAFPADMKLEEGEELQLRDSETDETFRAYVVEVHPDHVVLDFNHPLAGETLHFEVKVVDVRQATREELLHGHVHGVGGHHH